MPVMPVLVSFQNPVAPFITPPPKVKGLSNSVCVRLAPHAFLRPKQTDPDIPV